MREWFDIGLGLGGGMVFGLVGCYLILVSGSVLIFIVKDD